MWRVTPVGWTFMEFVLVLFAAAVIGFATGAGLSAIN